MSFPYDAFSSLPANAAHFLGRGGDVARLLELLNRHRLITLTGFGGIGKTQLALAVARAVAREHGPDAVLYVDLRPIATADTIHDRLLAALGLTPPQSPEALAARLRVWRLVLLDDLHAAFAVQPAAVRTLLRTLRDGSEPARLLATNRMPLGLVGEHPYAVGQLEATEAEALFRAVAKEQSGHRWEPGDEARLTALVQELDGYPLAIRLAAEMLWVISLADLAQQWRARGTTLLKQYGVSEAELDAQTSVDLAVAWSLETGLADAARRTAFLFADLPAGATSETLEAVLGEDWLGIAAALVSRGLLQREGRRYTMLIPIREFMGRHAGDEVAGLRQALDCFLHALAQQWGGNDNNWIQRQGEAMAALTAELPNLHAALDRAKKRQEHCFVAEVAIALSRFYDFALPGVEVKQRLADGIAASRAAGLRRLQAKSLLSLGNVQWILGLLRTFGGAW